MQQMESKCQMRKVVFVLLGIFGFFLSTHGSINVLHEFAGGNDDGAYPIGSLILSGTTLYGMTYNGNEGNLGTIFKIATNGTGFSLLHEFAGGNDDGSYPHGSLILSGNMLYGMTCDGGDSNKGTIFKIATNGTGFALLHEFAGGNDDGAYPIGSLILSGSTLYGMTQLGGSGEEYGTIFKIQTDGIGFTLLHEFTGETDDGAHPLDSLILSGTTLYGMTSEEEIGDGNIFKIATNGTGFTVLHEFAGGVDDGNFPNGSLILSGTTLYGMTYHGGDSEWGTIFKISTNGTGFALLHEFASGADDGMEPVGSLILYGSMLYGMTPRGCDSGLGTIFRIATNGTGFSLLHEFAGGVDDGGEPWGSLILSGNMLYGMTSQGGDSNLGTIFSMKAFPVAADFNDDNVTDLVWRHYAAEGGNTVWLMSEATAGAGAGDNEVEGEGLKAEGEGDNEVEGIGLKVEGGENKEEGQEITDVGAELVSAQMDAEEGRSTESLLQDVYESSLPEGEYMSIDYPQPEYPGPVGAISILFNVPLPALADLKWKICGTGDFNGDYKEDILWRYYGTGGSNAVWLMDGTNKTSAVALPAQTDVKWEIVGTGDFNGDQKVDILWRNKTNGKNMIWLMNGVTRSSIVNLPSQSNLTWKIGGCGDFNGDGKTDMLWRFEGAGGKNQVWLMNGTVRQSIVTIKAETNVKWKIAGIGDFNKDGKADIIWRNYSTGGANRIWIMNNTAYLRTENLPAVADLTWKIEN